MKDGRLRALFWAGLLLPDVLRGLWAGLMGAPEELLIPTRSPLGLIPWCAAAALLFEPDWRPRAFFALLLGAELRLLFGGPIYWAFPFGMSRVEWIATPWALLLAPLVEWLAAKARRASSSKVACAD